MNANGTMTYFLWNGLNLLQELNLDGTVKEEHTNTMTPIDGITQLAETYRPAQPAALQKIYPIMDMRGTITKWVESDGTTVLASREYDAFGTLIPNSAVGTWPGRFGYQGQTWIEIGSADGTQRLLLSPTRIYDSSTGRFLQRDPLIKYLLTGKLDKDFVDLNSVNRRYHFPFRNYFPFRGQFVQIDPLFKIAYVQDKYRYVRAMPGFFVDPLGLQEHPPGQGANQSSGMDGQMGLTGPEVDWEALGATGAELAALLTAIYKDALAPLLAGLGTIVAAIAVTLPLKGDNNPPPPPPPPPPPNKSESCMTRFPGYAKCSVVGTESSRWAFGGSKKDKVTRDAKQEAEKLWPECEKESYWSGGTIEKGSCAEGKTGHPGDHYNYHCKSGCDWTVPVTVSVCECCVESFGNKPPETISLYKVD